ncbi:hypothetical protein OE88DRAFT_1643416 [Heliocybe sulcata]|uniref:Glucose receptor Git3 N-terminal domain-containing protein n=1 Tax=Heliocybe sulcata TaxID=5364 RepID=A0A5C3N9H9_9AGAM|nr:hypothetical protein OE88DRAFT_1643416 [Heliocybe sulcata]
MQRQRKFLQSPGQEGTGNRPIQRPVDLYVLFLFIFGAVEALGAIVNIRWVYEGKMIGETGTAMVTLVIALHTFVVLWWRARYAQSMRVAWAVICVICIFLSLFIPINIAVNQRRGEYYIQPTPNWCWIGEKYTAQRLIGEYIWMWTTLVTSVAVYIPLYFLWRGNITVDDERWWKFHVHRRLMKTEGSSKLSLAMLAYPAVYSATVVPSTVARWYQFTHPYPVTPTQSVIPTGASFFCEFVFRVGPVFNVLLYVRTRPELSLFGRRTGASRRVDAPSSVSMAELPAGELEKGTLHHVSLPVITVTDADEVKVQEAQEP